MARALSAIAVAFPTDVTGPVRLAFVVTFPAVKEAAVPDALVATRAEGSPRAGVIRVGDVLNTTFVEVVPVAPAAEYPVIELNAAMPALVAAVPPLATGRVPETPVANATCAHAGLLLAPVFVNDRVALASLANLAGVFAADPYMISPWAVMMAGAVNNPLSLT